MLGKKIPEPKTEWNHYLGNHLVYDFGEFSIREANSSLGKWMVVFEGDRAINITKKNYHETFEKALEWAEN